MGACVKSSKRPARRKPNFAKFFRRARRPSELPTRMIQLKGRVLRRSCFRKTTVVALRTKQEPMKKVAELETGQHDNENEANNKGYKMALTKYEVQVQYTHLSNN